MKELKLWIPGRIIPKARPRFHQGRAMLPLNYRRWQNKTYLYVVAQIRDLAVTELPFEKAAVEIQFIGSHLGDLDNLAGALLDVMTKTNIVKDDRISCIPKLILSHEPGETCGALLRVEAMAPTVGKRAKAKSNATKASAKCSAETAVKTLVKARKKSTKTALKKTRSQALKSKI